MDDLLYALLKCQGRALKGARKSQSILDNQYNYTKSYVSREKIKEFKVAVCGRYKSSLSLYRSRAY